MNVEYFNNYGAGKELILLNMDEVPVYYDIQRNSTYHWKGDKSIKVIRTNGEKKRITVCFVILSNGKKLPPMVIFKGKKNPNKPI